MSGAPLPAPANDFTSTETRGRQRIAVITLLAAVWLALGTLAGLLIGLSTGLIPFSC